MSRLPLSSQENTIDNRRRTANNKSSAGSREKFSSTQGFDKRQPQKELLVMTIEIGDGRRDALHVLDNDDPNDLALHFIAKHGLSPSITTPLARHIQSNIEQVIFERAQLMKNRRASEQKVRSNYERNENFDDLRDVRDDFPAKRTLKPAALYQDSPSASQITKPFDDYSSTLKKRFSKTPDAKARFSVDTRTNNAYTTEQKLRKSFNSRENPLSEADLIDDIITNPETHSNSRDANYFNSELTFKPQINTYSRMLLESKFEHQNKTVYDRLHDKAKMKAARQKSLNAAQQQNQSTTKPSNISDVNYGMLLYHKGIKKREDKQKNVVDIINDRIQQEEFECSFKPQINPISVEIVNNRSRTEPPEEQLIRYGREKREKHERAKGIRRMEETEACSFKPEINPISEKIVEEKKKILPTLDEECYLKLFNDGKTRQAQQVLKAKAIDDGECTFTPAINPITSKRIENTTFEQRTRIFMERKEQKQLINKQKYSREEFFNEENGVHYFRPTVGRPPKNPESTADIWNHLYNGRIEAEDKKKRLDQKYKQIAQSKMARSSEKSERIVRFNRRKKLEEIFHHLDSDGDGFISQTKIDITAISTEVLEILAPLLCEMEEQGRVLSIDEFVNQTEELLKTLPLSTKDKLFAKRRQISSSQFRFQPTINANSEKLARRKRPQSCGTLHDMYLDQQKELQEKLELEREKKIQEEMKSCSFKPIFFSNPNASRSNYNHQYFSHFI